MKELPKQTIAIKEFRPYIARNKIKIFDKAWNEYYNSTADSNGFNDYFIGGDINKCKQLFNQRINAVIEFAKEKYISYG